MQPHPLPLLRSRIDQILEGRPLRPLTNAFLNEIEKALSTGESAVHQRLAIEASGLLDGLERSPLEITMTSLKVETAAHRLADAFLVQVRDKAFTSKVTSESSASGAFMDGALSLFPQAEKLPFMIQIAKTWAKSDAREWVHAVFPDFRGRPNLSWLAGRDCSQALKRDYTMALEAKLPQSAVRQKLHLRDVRESLAAKGWMIGRIESLYASDANDDVAVRAHFEEFHHPIFCETFSSNNSRYPEEALSFLLQCSHQGRLGQTAVKNAVATGKLRLVD